MPVIFRKWLNNLSDEDAAEMWLYFDGGIDPGDVVEVIAESHRELSNRMCGDYEE